MAEGNNYWRGEDNAVLPELPFARSAPVAYRPKPAGNSRGLFPWELGKKADPFTSAPAGIKPEWYFLFMFQTLKYIPGKLLFFDGEVFGIMLFGIAGVLWMLVPFWDRKSARGERNRSLTYVGLVIVLYIIVLTIIGWLL